MSEAATNEVERERQSLRNEKEKENRRGRRSLDSGKEDGRSFFVLMHYLMPSKGFCLLSLLLFFKKEEAGNRGSREVFLLFNSLFNILFYMYSCILYRIRVHGPKPVWIRFRTRFRLLNRTQKRFQTR